MTAPITLANAPTPVVIAELEYASDLLQRAQQAIDQEFRVLRGAGVQIDFHADRVTFDLLHMAYHCHMLALDARAALQGIAMGTCPGGVV